MLLRKVSYAAKNAYKHCCHDNAQRMRQHCQTVRAKRQTKREKASFMHSITHSQVASDSKCRRFCTCKSRIPHSLV